MIKFRLFYISILAILPSTVIFNSFISGTTLYQIFAIIFFLIEVLYIYPKIHKSLFIMVLSTGISIIGLLLWKNISLSTFFSSFINFFIVVFLYSNSIQWLNKQDDLSIQRNLKCYNFLLLLLIFLGFLQFFGIINFSSRDYITYSGDIISKISKRSTSIFNEPSAFAYFLCLGYFINRGLTKNRIFCILIVISIITTISLTGILLLICVELFLNRKEYFKTKYFLFILFIIMTYIFLNINIPILEFIVKRITSGSFGDYRTLAPIKALYIFISNPVTVLFGNGLGTLQEASIHFNLSETASTTHNFFVDIIFEIGIIGFSIYIFSIINKIKSTKYLLIMFCFLFIGTGYRSGRFLLLFSLIYLGVIYEKRKV